MIHASNTTTNSVRVGILELDGQGAGRLRDPVRNYASQPGDPFVGRDLVARFRLAGGEAIEWQGATKTGGKSTLAEASLVNINGVHPEEYAERTAFADLLVIDPREPLRLETTDGPLTTRVIDLMTPVGKGQRALIVAPPRTGKTILLQQTATAVRANHPEVLLMVLLVDERPEEVTEMRRMFTADGSGWHVRKPEVVYSSNDQDAARHIRISRLMIEKAKRFVELGRHVVIVLDSLTRLSRAFNSSIGSSGRTMTGGLDIRALAEPKAIFGAARNIEGGGSLTIVASVLIETGSRMDDFIFQEFKGTGNMELVLTRELANLRIWPAVDLEQSGTRKEELLLGTESLGKVSRLRRRLMSMAAPARVSVLLEELGKHKSNPAFLAAMAS